MHPVLLDFGWFNVYSFGFMLAVSFLVGIYLSSWRAKRYGVDPQHVLDLSVYLILTGVVGSRLLYVVFHLGEYNSFVDVFALWQGGATLYGGFLLAIFAAYVYAAKKNVGFFLVADILSPALALGIMLTRVGCYLSGCCFGSPTDRAWGVVFPSESAAGAYARGLADRVGEIVHLHPTQLYASFFGLVTFAVLMLAEKRLVKRGATFGMLLVLYGVFRFTLDFFRYYEDNMRMFLDLTLNQWISVGLFALGVYLLLRKTDQRTERVKAG
ncbi:MAG: prolipoprotein diacylglyceryl transferase [Candidatus Krumholzibacteriia bacterium]